MSLSHIGLGHNCRRGAVLLRRHLILRGPQLRQPGVDPALLILGDLQSVGVVGGPAIRNIDVAAVPLVVGAVVLAHAVEGEVLEDGEDGDGDDLGQGAAVVVPVAGGGEDEDEGVHGVDEEVEEEGAAGLAARTAVGGPEEGAQDEVARGEEAGHHEGRPRGGDLEAGEAEGGPGDEEEGAEEAGDAEEVDGELLRRRELEGRRGGGRGAGGP